MNWLRGLSGRQLLWFATVCVIVVAVLAVGSMDQEASKQSPGPVLTTDMTILKIASQLNVTGKSMARELGSKGVHVAHVIVDGMIASARTGGQTPDESRLDADAISETYLALHRQPRSAWTHEIDLRPWVERF